MKSRTIFLLSTILLFSFESKAIGAHPDQEFIDAKRVVVKAVFFVPKNATEPTLQDAKTLERHIRWTQERYLTMLGNRDTFQISNEPITTYHSSKTLDYYRKLPERGAPWYTEELLQHFGYDRNTCPYIFIIMVANDKDYFPVEGGRNFNGGHNRGGGLLISCLYSMRQVKSFQSTLRHELGHAFGLLHVDVYGYSMRDNASLMSYNRKHKTDRFKDSATPGVLIPEDIRALAKNKRVLPKLVFDPEKDVPKGYKINKRIRSLSPIKLPSERKSKKK
jgi:hypothetical protein